MFLSDFSIKRPIAMIVIIILMMCLGLLALKDLRVNENPDIAPPYLSINIPYPGASPETVEREIVDRIEKSLRNISGVVHVNATAQEGSANFGIEFVYNKNMIEATDDARNVIAAVAYKLPEQSRAPIFQRADDSAEPFMYLNLTTTTQTHAEISRYAEDVLTNRFREVAGVSTLDSFGSLNRELSVLLQTQKLREYNVSVSEVVNALRNQNLTAPVGTVHGTMEEQSIRLVGRIESPAQFEQVVIKRRGDQIVRLGQVARIEDGFADINGSFTSNGKASIGFGIIRARDASTITVAAKIRALVDEVNKTLPKGTVLEITNDGGTRAEQRLRNVTDALIIGAFLTVFVVYVFLNSWRSILITSLSLPTSVIAAFIVIWLCGFTLNFMTLLALSLAIGVLIDDAIVVRENIVRHMEAGEDRMTAAINGTREIGFAVAATTFSIIAVFIPVAFMPGVAGQWFKPFALTVAFSVLVSLLISFTLDPMLSAYWGDPVGYHHAEKRGISLWLSKFNAWFDIQSARYSKVIAWALQHRISMAVIVVLSLVLAIGIQVKWVGTEFVPKIDADTINVTIRMPASTSFEYAKLKVEKASEMSRTVPEVKWSDSFANAGSGNIYIHIGKRSERKRDSEQISADLRKLYSTIIGAEFVVAGEGAGRPVQVQFHGPDGRKLMEMTNAYMEQLRKVKGAVDIRLSQQEPKDELQIDLNRGLANSLGISVGDVAQSLNIAFAGIRAGDWIDPNGETRDVAVRLDPADRVNAENIERLPIAVAGTDQMVPIDQIARITMGTSPSQIRHEDGIQTVSVSANVDGRPAGDVSADALKLAQQINFPPGYGLGFGGDSRNQVEVFSAMGIALLMGIALMYLILVMQFGSFTAPAPVLLSILFSPIGVVLALFITNCTLNLMSLIGVIMLAGLVAKNAILLVDCARKHEAEGHGRHESLMYAGRVRLRPILMTTFALIAGMLPVAIGLGEGGEFYRPMAVAIIGGMLTSTVLTLLIVPTFYDSIEIARDRMVAKFRRRAENGNAVVAFFITGLEVILTLTLIRFCYRGIGSLARFSQNRGHRGVL